MFGRIRRLEISLAAKCQLLFGAAVVLIIAAALLWPWQRMEQLTQQLNERAAGLLADEVLEKHVAGVADHGKAPSSSTAPAEGSGEIVARLTALPPKIGTES